MFPQKPSPSTGNRVSAVALDFPMHLARLRTSLDPILYSAGDRNGINTLFVFGLCVDAKARDIHNLFRRRAGLESCQIKYTGRGDQAVAFATFVNHQSAMAALHSLNIVKFDPQTGSTLHIELARSNSRRKNKLGNGPYVVFDRRTKSDTSARESSSDDGEGGSDELPSNLDAGNQYDSAADKSTERPCYDNDAFAPENEQAEKPADAACTTLFIGNLGPKCSEELEQVPSQ